MKAIVHRTYGPPDVLTFEDVKEPSVGPNDVLIDVKASSINAADWHILRGEPLIARVSLGLRTPKEPILGMDVAGVVLEVGDAVTNVAVGDEVYGQGRRAFAERVALPAADVAPKPPSLTFTQAAAVPLAGDTAMRGLHTMGGITAGQRVLVHGASGGVGTFAVQIAKAAGAHVTGVCSTPKVERVRALGADEVIDRRMDDLLNSGARWDLILDLGGTLTAGDFSRVLTPDGTLVMSSGDGGRWLGPIGRLVGAKLRSLTASQSMDFLPANADPSSLVTLADLIAAGKLSPLIDQTFELADVPAAIRHLESGKVCGKVAITV